MRWYLAVLKKYAVFSGRAGRKEYWLFYLFNFLILFVLSILDGVLGTAHHEGGIGWLSGLYLLFILIPVLAVTVRRLHDSNRTAWWALTFMIPVIGLLVWLFMMIEEGSLDDNRYGPNSVTP